MHIYIHLALRRLSYTARQLARKSIQNNILIAEGKLVHKIRAKHCKSSEFSVYIVVSIYSANAFHGGMLTT